MTGTLKRAVAIIRDMLGPNGCCCNPRDRGQRVRGHCLACFRARRFLARFDVDADLSQK